MKCEKLDRVVDARDAIDRARALRGLHQAMALGNLLDAVVRTYGKPLALLGACKDVAG